MINTGIIAEFNPFHNGHEYLFNTVRELGADCVFSVMSGNFVQRGAPALFDKYTRACAALEYSDICFELPFYFATASAEYFAFGGISLLTALHADYVAFGTECGEIEPLMELAEYLLEEPAPFKEALNESLKAGNPFPVAREDAVKKCLGEDKASYLRGSNNLLGVEYCKAILKLKKQGKKPPVPVTVKREGILLNDIELELGVLPSATALRIPLTYGDLKTAKAFIPERSVKYYENALKTCIPGKYERLSHILAYCLMTEDIDTIVQYADWNEDFARRVMNLTKEGSINFGELPYKLVSKNITYSRAARMLLALVMKKKEETLRRAVAEGGAFYARLLGVNSGSTMLLKDMTVSADIPVINKTATGEKELSGTAKELFDADIRAANLYNLLFCEGAPDDYRHGIEIV